MRRLSHETLAGEPFDCACARSALSKVGPSRSMNSSRTDTVLGRKIFSMS